MDFKQIEELKKEDCAELLTERLNGKFSSELEPLIIDDALLEVELDQYKDELIKKRIDFELNLLVDNNCATIKAFPESRSNHKMWIFRNILAESNAQLAKERLIAIQEKEIELAQLKIDNEYKEKRRAEYPDMMEYIDAKVKQFSTDQKTQDEGIAQERSYLESCLAVKAKYPKGSK